MDVFTSPYFWLPALIIMAFSFRTEYKKIKEEKAEKEKSIAAKIEEENRKKSKIATQLKGLDALKSQISQLQSTKIAGVSEYKNIVINNESSIASKGGDSKLYEFLKIDTFLRDFHAKLISDRSGVSELINFEQLKSQIIEEANRDDLEKIVEALEFRGFDLKIEKLFSLGDLMNVSLENSIKTLEYYKNIASAMIVFYLNDNKIRYFEIHEAFERLGVFDSSWQNNVLKTLGKIDTRLSQINNQLNELNGNFISLVESSENVVSELKEIDNSIMTNNILQSIAAYQSWRINNNTKGYL